MARTRNQTTQTVRRDAVDELVIQLNTISGIEFVRDAWLNKAPDNYGVVELNGETRQLWADGHLTDSIWRVTVTLYVKGDDDTWAKTVDDKLIALEDAGKVDLTHTISREFAYDIGKTCWRWTVNLYADLTWDEEVPAQTETVGDG